MTLVIAFLYALGVALLGRVPDPQTLLIFALILFGSAVQDISEAVKKR